MNAHMTWPGDTLALFAAADHAMRQVPPAFPLEATVAVNPWLGQAGEDRIIAAARMSRVGNGRMFLAREAVTDLIGSGLVSDADLDLAAAAHGFSPDALAQAVRMPAPRADPLPTVADLAVRDSGIDWPDLIEDRIGLWAASHFDRGQAFWPTPGTDAWSSWRAFASRDLTPGLAGLSGFAAAAAAAPTQARTAFASYCDALGITPDIAALYFHRVLATLSGWAQYARHLGWLAEHDDRSDATLFDLLTIRLGWEVGLLEAGGAECAASWEMEKPAYAATVEPDADLGFDAALQEAVDRAAERRLAVALAVRPRAASAERAAIQAAFCIDVRSEVLRRALEACDPGIRTIGFAGFFGLPLRYRARASDIVEARAPILLSPAIGTRAQGAESADRIRLRTIRAWGRFKRAAVSAFAFVEAAGPLYVGKLLRDGLGLAAAPSPEPVPEIDLPLEDRITAAAGILRAMSLTRGFARLVLICGHGAHVANMPHASALQCGACGGHAGDVNARVLAALLNDGAVRDGLGARGIAIPDDTRFVAGLHDTVSDEVRLYGDDVPPTHHAELNWLRAALARAGAMARTERAAHLPRGTAKALPARGHDWSEMRPEWGLAGCRGFIAAPRHRTAGLNLGGAVFLHDYDWRQDEDAATLGLILSAPVVVASWISLQYNGSAVAPDTFGAGNKVLHNVVGGIGVVEGNGGALRTGLPWQSVHDGATLRHLPSRLVVAVEAPEAMISDVLARQPEVRALFDNGWLSLCAIGESGGLERRYDAGAWIDRDASGPSRCRAA